MRVAANQRRSEKRRLKWYGHVRREEDEDVLTSIRDWTVDGRRPRGTHRKNSMDNEKQDMRDPNITTRLYGTLRDEAPSAV